MGRRGAKKDTRRHKKTADVLLDTKEVAHRVGVTRKTVRRWLNDPDHPLVGMRVNSRLWRVSESALTRFLQEAYWRGR